LISNAIIDERRQRRRGQGHKVAGWGCEWVMIKRTR